MALNALHHVTVKTNDLEATRDFYRDVRLKVGFRPDLRFSRLLALWWRCTGGAPGAARHRTVAVRRTTGPFDHFAFLASDFAVKATEKKGVKYRENHIASPAIDQLFFPTTTT
jgi:catechol 2,3-dioxygenase-like lactoylglutathione lyase family enzyme